MAISSGPLNGELANGHSAAASANNHPVNGHTNNDHSTNGHTTDGHTTNDQTTNGHTTNGHTTSGHSTSDHTTNGHATPNGSPDTGSRNPPKPIAICGMACRLPSGIKSPKQLWEFLLAGGDARGKVPESRYNIEAFYDPSGKPGTIKTQHGYFLDEDVGHLDTSLFSMPRKEVERLDPQQRLMLEVARECLEDGGETGWRGKRIGCYMGNLNEDWLEIFTQDVQNYGIYRVTGHSDFSLSNRVSYELDLQGPSMTIRTACSASMLALHEACVAIERGDCVSAIVGGTNLILRPFGTTAMSEQGILSPDGSCKTFSADANGYGRGEAVLGVFVKPLEDAIRDGNSIRAVIRATATNHDGKTVGFSLPSSDAQEIMIRRAYEVAGLPVSETAFVECHGTGTSVGDPIETKAIARVFGQEGITIGSTKPNFGHTEGASGILSVMKTVLALENKTIPPSIKCSPRNPNIPWESGKLALAEEPTSWPRDRLERASVNSFGLGGSNAHVILDSAASHLEREDHHQDAEGEVDDDDAAQLLLFSANTQQSLTKLINNYKTLIEDETTTPSQVNDIAYTLARGRDHLPYRAFATAKGSSVGAVSPISKPPGQRRAKIAMVFTGQGAQWPQMGSHLLRFNPTFASTIRSLDKYLKNTLGEEAPDWSLEKELLKAGEKSRLSLAEFAQPLCTAVQVALVDTLRSVGVEADAVVGHSSGEIAAAYAAGALTAGEAIVVALCRGIVASKQNRHGAMAALGLGSSDAEKFLVPNTGIACDNSPRSVTISGDADKIDEVLAAVVAANPETLARKLQVDKAYHSYHMTEIGEIYNSSIEHKMVAKGPKKLFFSSVESRLLDDSTTLGSRYWQKNLESPVLFNGAVTRLLAHFSGQDVILLEVGPHSALAGPLKQIVSEAPNSSSYTYIPTIIRKQNSVENLLSTLGKLYTFHIPIDLQALFPSGSCVPDLPRYPYHHSETPHWHEARVSKEYRQRKYPHHDLLGVKVLESTDLEPAWRNLLHVGYNTTWLRDHKVGNDIVFPFAGYVAMAGEAVRQVTKIEGAFRLRNVSVGTAMLLSEENPTEIITTFRPLPLNVSKDSSWYEFTISAHNGDKWTKHCSGEVKAEEGSILARTPTPGPFPRSVGWEKWFDNLRREGLDLGPGFHNLDNITASTTTYESQGTLSSNKYPESPYSSKYHIHPAVLDSALQLLSVAGTNGLMRKHKNFLPIFCSGLFVARTTGDVVVNVDVGDGPDSSRIGQIRGVAGGKIVLQLEGLKMTPASITGDSEQGEDPHAASRLTWAPDIDFADHLESLFQGPPSRHLYGQSLEELGRLSVLSAQRQLARIDVPTDVKTHLKKYIQWINTQVQLHETTSSYDDETLSQKIHLLRDSLANTPAAPVAETLHLVSSNIVTLVSSKVESWESLVPNDTVTKFFEFISEFDSSAFFKLLGHSKPNLRVLEIGGNWKKAPLLKSGSNGSTYPTTPDYKYWIRGLLLL